DQKVTQIYALEVAPSGLKMQESPADNTAAPGCKRDNDQTKGVTIAVQVALLPDGRTVVVSPEPGGTGISNLRTTTITAYPAVAVCHKLSSADIAQQLMSVGPGYFTDGPIVDLTGLKGVYDFTLEWFARARIDAGAKGPNLYDAVQSQLGLTLQKRRQA